MPAAPLPLNETERLAALRAIEILDTPNEAAFEIFPALARVLAGTPIAAVSLVDETRQWFKAISGLDIKETSRDAAFCAHAILTPDRVMCVTDATADPRFADNPLVTGGPGIRFYAGAPIVDENGLALGTVCVIDTVPREVPAHVLDSLRNLAGAASTALQHRAALRKLHDLDALRRAVDIERETIERQRRFIEIVSHELRTPAALIDGAAQRARSRLEAHDPAGAARHVDRIRAGVVRLAAMIDRTLAHDMRDKRRTAILVDRFDLRDALGAVVERHRAAAAEFSIALDMPDTPVRIDGDREMLDHAFDCLMENAIKYARGERVVTVRLSIEAGDADQGRARIEVADRGIGIPHADLGKLFHRFSRASNAHAIPGTGLGLHLARNLVADHDGEILVASELGQGTTFTVLLPLSAMSARDAA